MSATIDVDHSVIGGLRKHVLDCLLFNRGSASTSEILEYSNIPSGSRRHHLDKLREAGLIERSDTRESARGGSDEFVYSLTERGSEVAREVCDAEQKPDMDDVYEQVRQLKHENHELREENEELRDDVDELLDKMESVKNIIRVIHDNEDYLG